MELEVGEMQRQNNHGKESESGWGKMERMRDLRWVGVNLVG